MSKGQAKIRAKLKDNILKVKFMITHIMVGKIEANHKNIEADYITHIVLRVGERILFDFKPSGNMANNPLIKFKVKQKEIKEGDLLELEWTTLLGEKGYKKKKIINDVNP